MITDIPSILALYGLLGDINVISAVISFADLSTVVKYLASMPH